MHNNFLLLSLREAARGRDEALSSHKEIASPD